MGRKKEPEAATASGSSIHGMHYCRAHFDGAEGAITVSIKP
jgi:hypothetical protein